MDSTRTASLPPVNVVTYDMPAEAFVDELKFAREQSARKLEALKKVLDADGLESELNIYNWSDYIGVETIANFEFETGVRVTYDTYESNEELAAKLLAGASGYDLCVPSGYILPVLREAGLLQPLDTAALEGWSNLGETFTERVEAEGKTWGMPWQWGMTGIAYRRDLVPVRPSTVATRRRMRAV